MRESVRAVIIGADRRMFLVQHHEKNPDDIGKWATAGGGIDQNDENHISCLRRELSEEFGGDALDGLHFGAKIRSHTGMGRIAHFYLVTARSQNFSPVATDEIMSCGWFTYDEAKSLRLFFGIESDLFAQALTILDHDAGP